jgi:hypothetical protein
VRLVEDCQAEVRERVLALGDTQLDMDAEVFADKQAVDSIMCAFRIGKNEATILVNLADRLTVLPEVGGGLVGRRPGLLPGAGAR